ncbi:MAG: phosphate ABC transporter substrate-binding protein [Gammaproteobacteria bacterium]|nr:phosphate ABC transporter substrate-binding protein [Gammaproteobacteria bacterium]
MKTIVYRLTIFTALLMASLVAYADEVVVVVHPSNTLTEMSVDDVRKIYLGKKKYFPGGTKVTPGDQPKGTKSRKFFYGGIVRKKEAKLKSYWSRLIFTGKGTPPKIIGLDHVVKEWVASQPRGMGYIMRSEADDTVKILDLK